MKRIRAIIFIILSVLIIAAISAVMGYRTIEANLERLEDMEIKKIDLSRVADGTYTGSCQVFPVSAEVRVTVKDGRIASIKLVEHKNGRGTAAEIITDRVVRAQTSEVDIISGATYSSKVILKAIENALDSAGK